MAIRQTRLVTSIRNWKKRRAKERKLKQIAMGYLAPGLKLAEAWASEDKETSNFYYKLTDINQDQLLHLIANVTGTNFARIEEYAYELENDDELRSHLEDNLRRSGYGRDIKIEYGRRLGWYIFTRVTKPRIVVETGIDHGVGSCVIASALLRNNADGSPGRYYGTELRREAGKLFTGKYASVGQILYGDSIQSLSLFEEKIDLFINDSDHSAEYEYQEYNVVSDKLSDDAILISDNAHVTDCLSRFSRENARNFLFFSEKPKDHWYPGAGIGISFKGNISQGANRQSTK